MIGASAASPNESIWPPRLPPSAIRGPPRIVPRCNWAVQRLDSASINLWARDLAIGGAWNRPWGFRFGCCPPPLGRGPGGSGPCSSPWSVHPPPPLRLNRHDARTWSWLAGQKQAVRPFFPPQGTCGLQTRDSRPFRAAGLFMARGAQAEGGCQARSFQGLGGVCAAGPGLRGGCRGQRREREGPNTCSVSWPPGLFLLAPAFPPRPLAPGGTQPTHTHTLSYVDRSPVADGRHMNDCDCATGGLGRVCDAHRPSARLGPKRGKTATAALTHSLDTQPPSPTSTPHPTGACVPVHAHRSI